VVRIANFTDSGLQPIVVLGRNADVTPDLTMRSGSDGVLPVGLNIERCSRVSRDRKGLDRRNIVGLCGRLTLNLLSEFDKRFTTLHREFLSCL
jgi:hypothetical protein